jgi:hypothetical protein
VEQADLENRLATRLDARIPSQSFRWEKARKRPPAAGEYYGSGMNVLLVFLAEREGFEPSLGYYPKHAFQACDLNRSSTSPLIPAFAAGREF